MGFATGRGGASNALVLLQAGALFGRKKASPFQGFKGVEPITYGLGRLIVEKADNNVAVTFSRLAAAAKAFGHLQSDSEGRVRHALKMHYPLA